MLYPELTHIHSPHPIPATLFYSFCLDATKSFHADAWINWNTFMHFCQIGKAKSIIF